MKKMKMLLSVVLTAILLLCMAATAFAAPASVGITASDTSQTVTKTWTVASLSQMNDTEVFTFDLEYTGAEKVNPSIDTATPQLNSSDMTSKTVTITDTWLKQAADADKLSAAGSLSLVELFSGITFSSPGIYTFDLSEVAGSNANIDYSSANSTITVVV